MAPGDRWRAGSQRQAANGPLQQSQPHPTPARPPAPPLLPCGKRAAPPAGPAAPPGCGGSPWPTGAGSTGRKSMRSEEEGEAGELACWLVARERPMQHIIVAPATALPPPPLLTSCIQRSGPRLPSNPKYEKWRDSCCSSARSCAQPGMQHEGGPGSQHRIKGDTAAQKTLPTAVLTGAATRKSPAARAASPARGLPGPRRRRGGRGP